MSNLFKLEGAGRMLVHYSTAVAATFLHLRHKTVSLAFRTIPYTRTAAVIQGVFLLLFFYWFQVVPLPGVASAALGFAAVTMAVRSGRFTRTEEIVWIIVAFSLFYVETRAIRQDRAQHDKEQAIILEQERRDFERILSQNEQHFDSTMARTGRLTELSEKNLLKTESAIGNITGGDSYCYLMFTPIGGSRFLITAIPQGRFPLHSVTAALVDLGKFDVTCPRFPVQS